MDRFHGAVLLAALAAAAMAQSPKIAGVSLVNPTFSSERCRISNDDFGSPCLAAPPNQQQFADLSQANPYAPSMLPCLTNFSPIDFAYGVPGSFTVFIFAIDHYSLQFRVV